MAESRKTDVDPHVELVIRGEKLVATASSLISTELCKAAGLEIVPAPYWKADRLEGDTVAIGQKVKVCQAFDHMSIPVIRNYGERTMQLFDETMNMSVAKAVAFTNGYPRYGQAKVLESWNAEIPEVSILNGVLYGYPDCCVNFYMDTRYHNVREPEGYKEALGVWEVNNPATRVVCGDCLDL